MLYYLLSYKCDDNSRYLDPKITSKYSKIRKKEKTITPFFYRDKWGTSELKEGK